MIISYMQWQQLGCLNLKESNPNDNQTSYINMSEEHEQVHDIYEVIHNHSFAVILVHIFSTWTY